MVWVVYICVSDSICIMIILAFSICFMPIHDYIVSWMEFQWAFHDFIVFDRTKSRVLSKWLFHYSLVVMIIYKEKTSLKSVFSILLISYVFCWYLLLRWLIGCNSEIRCVNSLGHEESSRCSDYKSTCQGDSWSLPIPLETGKKCYNGQEIDSPFCSVTASVSCTFTGFKCSNSFGEIMSNACTS